MFEEYENNIKASLYFALGLKEDGTPNYQYHIMAIAVIFTCIFCFVLFFQFSIYLFIICLVTILVLSGLAFYSLKDVKKRNIISAIAFERKTGKLIIPESYRKTAQAIEIDNEFEIQTEIKKFVMFPYWINIP